jgi:hypothetical protein
MERLCRKNEDMCLKRATNYKATGKWAREDQENAGKNFKVGTGMYIT